MAQAQKIVDVATLTNLEGQGFIRHADGTRSELVAGMKLNVGDIVITMPGGKATIQILDGRNFDLVRSQGDAIKIDYSVLDVLTDNQDVKVTDLSFMYSLVAHNIFSETAVDPYIVASHVDLKDGASDTHVQQVDLTNDPEAPAALGDTEGGDLLSGNTYVVVKANPIETEPSPFATSGFNSGFTPVPDHSHGSAPSPLAFLINEHVSHPEGPAVIPPVVPLLVNLSAPTLDYHEATVSPFGQIESTATYQFSFQQNVTLAHDVAVNWILQQQTDATDYTTGEFTIAAGHYNSGQSIAFNVSVPEEANSLTPDSISHDYSLGIFINNDAVIKDESGNVLSITSVTPDHSNDPNGLLANDISDPNKALIAVDASINHNSSNPLLAMGNDYSQENGSQTPEQAAAVFVVNQASGATGVDDESTLPIQVNINSTELHNHTATGTALYFDLNVYNDVGDKVTTLATLETIDSKHADHGAIGGTILGDTISYDPTLLSQLSLDLSSLQESQIDGHTLTVQLESNVALNQGSDPFAVLGLTNTLINGFYDASTQFTVADDTASEVLSISNLAIDPSYYDVIGSNALSPAHEITNPTLPNSFDTVAHVNVDFNIPFTVNNGSITYDVYANETNQASVTTNTLIGTVVFDSSGGVTSFLADGTPVPGAPLSSYDSSTGHASFYVALPNDETGNLFTISLGLDPSTINGTPAISDTNTAAVLESIDPTAVATLPFTIIPDVHVTASIDSTTGLSAGLIDDESPISFTVNVDHALAASNGSLSNLHLNYEIDVVDSSGNVLQALGTGSVTLDAGITQQSFVSTVSTNDLLEGQYLNVTLTDNSGAVYFDQTVPANVGLSTGAVAVEVANQLPTVMVAQDVDVGAALITITPTTPTVDDESALNVSFNYTAQAVGDGPVLGTEQFHVYTQSVSNGILTGAPTELLDPNNGAPIVETLDLLNGGSFSISTSAFADGLQQISLGPVDSSAEPVTIQTTPFNIVDINNFNVSSDGGIDTYVFGDPSEGNLPSAGGSEGNPLLGQDLLNPTNGEHGIQLDFGNATYVATAADFNLNSIPDAQISNMTITDNGVVQFYDVQGNPVVPTSSNVQQAVDFLAQNSLHHSGATVEFQVSNLDTTNTDTYVFHQEGSGYVVANISNTVAAGLDESVLANNNATIHLVHHDS